MSSTNYRGSPTSDRLKGGVAVLGFDSRVVKTFDDYLSIVGKKRAITSALAQELLKERSVDTFSTNHNLIVNTGHQQVGALVSGLSTAPFAFCGVGSGTATPTATDTDMTSAIPPRIGVSQPFQSGSNQTFWDTFFGQNTNNGTWNEAGLYNSSSQGIMGSHALFASTINKTTANTQVVEWNWTT